MNRITTLLITVMMAAAAVAQDYKTERDIAFTVKTDAYAKERLKLDIYHPADKRDCPVVVWFHGGGLEAGSKELPNELKGKGWVVVGVNYRLLPKVTVDKTLDDAAEAVAWVFKHIEAYGGDKHKIVVSGHSAGGYISMMLCLDKRWMARYGEDADSVMLYVPFSGQAVTHYNVRKMQGLDPLEVTIDEYAPIRWVRNDCPPLVLICGDREAELFGRYDENQYLARMMKLKGHQQTYLYELQGYGHGSMAHPAFHILETHLRRMLGEKAEP